MTENYVNLPIALLRFYWMAIVNFEFENIAFFFSLSAYDTNIND